MVKQVVVYDTETGEISQAVVDAFKAALASTLTTVDAGTDLSTARPTGAGVVYWLFSAGVDVGTDGANVVNGLPGDLYYVAGA